MFSKFPVHQPVRKKKTGTLTTLGRFVGIVARDEENITSRA